MTQSEGFGNVHLYRRISVHGYCVKCVRCGAIEYRSSVQPLCRPCRRGEKDRSACVLCGRPKQRKIGKRGPKPLFCEDCRRRRRLDSHLRDTRRSDNAHRTELAERSDAAFPIEIAEDFPRGTYLFGQRLLSHSPDSLNEGMAPTAKGVTK